jgi:hypothetical protein
MGRYYRRCDACKSRMTRLKEDSDGERQFYLCKRCGARRTFLPTANGMSMDWPKDVFDEAVKCGVVSKEGRVLIS